MVFNTKLVTLAVQFFSNTLFIVCLYPILFKENNLTFIELSLIFSLYYIIKEISPSIIPSHRLTKNVYFLIVGYLFNIGSYVLMATFHSFYWILLAVVINSFSSSVVISLSKQFFFDKVDLGSGSKKHYLAYDTALLLGFFVSIPVMYIVFLVNVGIEFYYFLALINLVGILSVLLMDKETSIQRHESRVKNVELYSSPTLLIFSLLPNVITVSYPLIISYISIEILQSPSYIVFGMLFYGVTASIVKERTMSPKTMNIIQFLNNLLIIAFSALTIYVDLNTFKLISMLLILLSVYTHLTLISSIGDFVTKRIPKFANYTLGITTVTVMILIPYIIESISY